MSTEFLMPADSQPAQKERSASQILKQVDAWRLAKQEAERDITLNSAMLSRLSEFGIALIKPLECSLHYRQNEGGEARLTTKLIGEMSVECQRCLEPVALSIDSISEFALLREDDDDAPEGLEPAICARDGLDLQQLIEDELMLLVPQSPTHEEGECEAPGSGQEKFEEPAEKPNPFAALAALKTDK